MTRGGGLGELDWRPTADQRARQLRAQVNHTVRAFFAHRQVLEVETPVLLSAVNPDPAIEPLAAAERYFLRTSPEFPLKRLLCAGSGPVYELGRVFRAGEAGRRHHQEFTMLEWYQPGYELDQLMTEVAELINEVLTACQSSPLPTAWRRHRDMIDELLGQPLPAALADLQQCCVSLARMDQHSAAAMDRSQCIDLLFSIAGDGLPLDQITFITHFPACQAALARLDPADPELALRFEAFAGGMELANGYDELADADVLEQRLQADNRRRRDGGQQPLPLDQALLDGQRHGLPACCGVSVGIDRLLMLAGGFDHIQQVINFPEQVQ